MTPRLRQLWRLDGALPPDSPALADGLQLHLAHAPLTTVLVQIGDQRRSYVIVHGCDGCAHDRCVPGCPAELLRRLLRQAAPDVQLYRVARGLATRPYTRVVLATPGPHPQPLEHDLIRVWPEARLALGWRSQRGHLQAGALLAVGADGPAPATTLHSRGWRVWPVVNRLRPQRASRAALPGVWLVAGARDLTPHLLMPKQLPQEATASVVRQPELDARLSSWLNLLLEHPDVVAEEAEPTPEDTLPSIWPSGPEGMPPATLGRLVEQIIAEPRFQSMRKGQSGITKGRLASLKYPGLTEAVARSLMVWFDRAGVLADPEDGQGPWRAPRPFALQDLPLIAQQLRATPLPTSAEVQAASGGDG